MKWLDNFTMIMRSGITVLEEKIQNPERMLHQLIIDMEQELENVRAGVAGAIADEIQLRKQTDRARETAEQWLERANAALRRGDEEAAKAALEQKLLAEQRADALQTEYRQQQQETAKLQDAVRDLEDKIRQARQKQTLLLARLVRAESQQNINRTLDGATRQSAFAQFSRLEDKVERAEALSEAHDRLQGRDPDAAELERRFAEQERKEKLSQELDALKRQFAGDEK